MAQHAASNTPGPNKLPTRYLQFQKRYPKVFQAYDALGAATAEAGSFCDKTRALVEIGISVGGQIEGGGDSHMPRANEDGWLGPDNYHVALFGTATIGCSTP